MKNNYPQQAANFILDAIFPIRCIGCGKYNTYFCSSCLDCVKKKKDLELAGSVAVFSSVSYNDKLVKKALKIFKYNFVKDMAKPLAEIINVSIENMPVQIKTDIFKGNPLLVPIPLHKKRLNWRGFNQAEILADEISKFYGLKVKNILIRNKNAKPQADIKDKENRMNNIKGSFICPISINGRNIILIDDVCTTGATINECAKTLAVNGAGKIKAIVVARG